MCVHNIESVKYVRLQVEKITGWGARDWRFSGLKMTSGWSGCYSNRTGAAPDGTPNLALKFIKM